MNTSQTQLLEVIIMTIQDFKRMHGQTDAQVAEVLEDVAADERISDAAMFQE